MLEEGIYEVFPRKIEKKIGDGKQYSYLSVEYVITSGEAKNKVLWDTISLSPKALWKVKQWLVAFGVEGNQDLPIEQGVDGELIIDEEGLFSLLSALVQGRTCSVLVEIEEPSEEGLARGWKVRNAIVEYRPESKNTGWEE